MRIAILHLSDIHIRDADDPVLERGESVAAAVRTRLIGADRCVVLVSGDLAHSGREEEYVLAEGFLNSIKAALVSDAPGHQVDIMMVPGNHDCDFTREGDARGLVLGALRDSVDESILDVATEVQAPFFAALKAFASPMESHSRLEWLYSLNVDGVTIDFRCFNTAWCSTLHEQQGGLRFPEAVAARDRAALTIAVLHHPFQWLAAPDARRLRRELESATDIILTGHEHEHTRRTQQVATGERNEFIEGGVLGDRDHPEKSSFNLLLLDSTRSQQRFYHFAWRNAMYHPVDGVEADWESMQVPALRVHRTFELSDDFREALGELGVSAEHPARGKLRLDDVFVYPDLREVRYRTLVQGAVTSAASLTLGGDQAAHYLITGGERSGRTSLAKKWYGDLLRKGVVPVLLDGKSLRYVNDVKFDETVGKAFAAQYSSGSYEQYRQLPTHRRALIIDDLHAAKIPSGKLVKLLDGAEAGYHHVVLFSHDFSQQLSEMTDARRILEERRAFAQYQIEQFGHLRRDDFVQKWFALDPALASDAARLSRKVVEAERTLDAIIGKNFVPAYPVFLLSMLQGLESTGAVDLHASTHGYFYELLIKTDLAAGASTVEYDIKVRFLSYLAYRSFTLNTEELSTEEFDAVHEEYRREYDINRPVEQLRAELQRNNILVRRGDSWRFRYDYIRYYFIAAYLAAHLDEQQVRDDVRVLAATLDETLSANILLFLAHLTKEPFVIESMLERARSLFRSIVPATLDGDVEFVDGVVDEAADIRFVEREPGESRRLLLAGRDEDDDEWEEDNLDQEYSAAAAWIGELGAAFKAMQILGQVLKNFPGSLKAGPKVEIAEECYSVGLRALGSMLNALEENHEAAVEWLKEGYREDAPYATDAELQQQARRSIAGLTRLAAYSSVQRIAAAVGSRDLMETFKKLRARFANSAGRLIDMAIRLDQLEAFPRRDLVTLYEGLGRRVPQAVLCMLTVRHMYLFDVDYSEKQAVCEKLGIPYQVMVKSDPRKKLLPREDKQT